MGRGKAYKNVICLGHLLDAVGKKMSKSLGNVVDPWEMMNQYGVDTLRLWMYCINQPGESKNFDEKTVALLCQQVFGLIYNVLAFYELYRDKTVEKNNRLKSENILDIWILARLDELIKLATENLDNYKLLEPTRALRDFINDLSTWYLRRSRERIKNEASNPEVEQAHYGARITLYFVLKTLAKILAPFAPFAAEDVWLKLKNEKDEESVHLAEWPQAGKVDSLVLKNMQTVRDICTNGNAERQKLGIPVRQPLAKLEVKDYKLSNEYIELIKEELNVKEIIIAKNIDENVLLYTQITPELKAEGDYRELVRALQVMRKKIGLTPSDIVSLTFETNDAGKKLIQKFEADMKKTVLVSEIRFKENKGEEIKIGELTFRVKIEKI
jgi:isoleucyl-tRNA synthetase